MCDSNMRMKMSLDCEVFEYRILNLLRRFVRENACDCIALSGGIDTSTIAAIAKLEGLDLRGFYAYFVDGIPRDLIYVNRLAKELNIPMTFIPMTIDYVKNVLRDVYECVKDGVYHELCIELRNDIVFYTVLKAAKDAGCRCVYTGSGGDELFAGYSFMTWLPENELESYRERWALYGRYPELVISRCIGIKVVAPYLSKEVIEEALKAPTMCVRGELFEGKRILRNILKRLGIDYIAERVKTPAEAGAGTDSICLTP